METGIHELTAAYALGALEPDERREYETHLRGCEPCQDELASFSSVTEALAVAASGPSPRLELRERILTAVRAEPQTVVPFAPRSRRALPAVAAVAAVAAVVALAIGLWAAQLSGDLDEARTALERERATAAVLADPDARTVALEEGEGHLVVAPSGRAVLVLHNLDPAPAGKTYQTWIMGEGEDPQSAGLFSGRESVDIVGVDGTVESTEVVAVTIEDAGGADSPSSAPIAGSLPV